MAWQRIHLCTGILERDGRILLVASRYANHREPLWNLPGGRQEPLEPCDAAVVRECREETGLDVRVLGLAYVAESFDRATQTQFTNFAFLIDAAGEPAVQPQDERAVDVAWVPLAELAARLTVRVVRDPLLGYLADRQRRFFPFADAGITIDFS
jgi:8-oxo-dGTP diphosphatase